MHTYIPTATDPCLECLLVGVDMMRGSCSAFSRVVVSVVRSFASCQVRSREQARRERHHLRTHPSTTRPGGLKERFAVSVRFCTCGCSVCQSRVCQKSFQSCASWRASCGSDVACGRPKMPLFSPQPFRVVVSSTCNL